MTIIIQMTIVVLLLILSLTQIVWPLFGHGRFFWLFRGPEKKLANLDKAIEEKRLNREVKEKYKQLKQGEKTTKKGDNNVSNI